MTAQQAHATALRMVRKNGFAVSFTHTGPSTEDASGQQTPGASVTVAGFAIQDDNGGDPAAYQTLKLVEVSAVRLYWTPTLLNTCPQVGDKSTFEARTVKTVDPYRVGANAEIIGAYLVVV